VFDRGPELYRRQAATMRHVFGALPLHRGDGIVPRGHHTRGANGAGARIWAALVDDNRDGAQRGKRRAKGNEGFPGKGRVGQLSHGVPVGLAGWSTAGR